MAQTKPKAGQFYGVSNNGTDGQFLQTDGTGGMAWAATITDPTITSIDYPGSATAADPAGGESVIINGTLFASGITCTVGGTSAVTAFNSATQITITTPAKAAGPYTIAVLNPDGGTASENNFIQYSGVPVWSTAAGTLGNVIEGTSASFQVTATEGSDTIEYAVTTGTLPTGLSLATATGAITGTAPTVSADTTTTFSITATDDENQTSASRSFSITVQNDAPSNHFNTVLYTGNQSARSIAVGFEPGFTWIKERNDTDAHFLQDSVRGSTYTLYSMSTAAQFNETQAVTSFTSTGFNLGTYTGTNTTNNTYVAWNFKAGGAAVANNDGIISTQVSANTTLGFSVITYDGATNATADASNNGGTYWNVAHGLGAAPDLVFVKKTNSAGGWYVGGAALGSTGTNGNHLTLNSSATQVGAPNYLWGGSQTFNTTTFGIGGWDVINRNGDSYLAYCFTSKPGFSKVGSYTGTGAAGNTVITGFEPAFVMLKRTDIAGSWNIIDNKRGDDTYLQANTTAAEGSMSAGSFDLLANGFILNNSFGEWNASGGTYIYLAIAADGSTATPSLANSFATELMTGNGSSQTINTGFKPDFIWQKFRNISYNHTLMDSVRSNFTELLQSNTTASQNTNTGVIASTSNTGFTTGASGIVTSNGQPMVFWNWKAGGTPSINTDGTSTSIVSANQAAGFSIVSFSNNNSFTNTFGHKLGAQPELVIIRPTSQVSNWFVYVDSLGKSKRLKLNTDLAEDSWSSNDGWNTATGITSSVLTFAYSGTSYPFIAYCFTSISGYSKVGSYSGTGAAQTITTGFQPGFLMVKASSHASSWYIVDSARTPNYFLSPNSNAAEYTDSGKITFTSNGFILGSTSYNNSGYTWIYLAIKEN